MVLPNSKMKSFSLLLVVLCSTVQLGFGRPKDIDVFYRKWKPLELVRGLRSLSVDPFDVFRSLQAVKELDSDEALDLMHELDVRPITIYDALDDLGVDPFDAYYALKAWLTDPQLHPPGDHYHRVNASGDPSHPYLHVSYKRTQSGDGQPKEDYKAQYMTSEEINKELKNIEEEYKKALSSDKFKMSDFINKAKKIHSAFDDPKKVFKDFFGERHFKEWRKLFPEAFKGLKDIYKNPLGFSHRKDKTPNVTTRHDQEYAHLQKAGQYGQPGAQQQQQPSHPWFRGPAVSRQGSDAFSQFNDPNRYDTLQDDTHVEQENPEGQDKEGKRKTHHIRRYYDKVKNMYVECKKTEECVDTPNGIVRKVQSQVRHFDPDTYKRYQQKNQQQFQDTQQPQPTQQPQQSQQPQQPQQSQQPQQPQQTQQPHYFQQPSYHGGGYQQPPPYAHAPGQNYYQQQPPPHQQQYQQHPQYPPHQYYQPQPPYYQQEPQQSPHPSHQQQQQQSPQPPHQQQQQQQSPQPPHQQQQQQSPQPPNQQQEHQQQQQTSNSPQCNQRQCEGQPPHDQHHQQNAQEHQQYHEQQDQEWRQQHNRDNQTPPPYAK